MKFIRILALMAPLLFPSIVQAQSAKPASQDFSYFSCPTFAGASGTASIPDCIIPLVGVGSNVHIVNYATTGGPTSVSFTVSASTDNGATYVTQGTTTGTTGSVSFTGVFSQVKIHVTTLSGGTNARLAAQYFGAFPVARLLGTGKGAAGQCAYFGSANTITGDSGCTYDGAGTLTLSTGLTVTALAGTSKLAYWSTSGVLTSLGHPQNGQFPIGSNAGVPVLGTLTAGTGVTITNGANSITVAASGPTGSGTAGQCAFWSGTSSLTGDANCLYNGTAFVIGNTVTTTIGSSLTVNGVFSTAISGNGVPANIGGLMFGNVAGTNAAIWSELVTPTSGNYGFQQTSAFTNINAASGSALALRIAANAQMTLTAGNFLPVNLALNLGDGTHLFTTVRTADIQNGTTSLTMGTTGQTVAINGNTTLYGNVTVAPTFGLTVNAGAGTSTMLTSGLLDSQVSAAGSGNGATTAIYTLFQYSVQPNGLDTNGDSLNIFVTGVTSGTANLKSLAFTVGGATCTFLSSTADISDTFIIVADITRVDATHVSVACNSYDATGNLISFMTLLPNQVVANLTTTPLALAVTGASPVTGAANDVVAYQMRTELFQK